MLKLLLTLTFLLNITCIYAFNFPEYCMEDEPMFHGNVLAIGPEWYWVNRTKKGGTKQNGSCLGVRANYDYIKRYNIYVGAQAFYGSGVLHGHTGSDLKLHSRLTLGQVEGSLGYTFQTKCWRKPWITPIVGYGYFWEKNSFSAPSPLEVKYTTNYAYVPFGFLSGIMLTPCLSIGLNVRARYPIDLKCRISDDPDYEDITQIIEDKCGYRIELPFVYKTVFFCRSLLVGLLPFYDLRHYGGRENYPFDFIETKLKSYGANVQVMYQF